MVTIEHLEVRYGKNKPAALAIPSLRIEGGERVAVIGPSGAGKSTLLRCLKGYVPPVQGKVEILGCNLFLAARRQRNRIKRRMGLIYQQFHLAPRMTVWQNVLCGRLGAAHPLPSLFGYFPPRDRRIAWEAICEVGLSDLVHQMAETLSGGEQQRVAVARALAQRPSLILADEPVSSLDPLRAAEVLQLLSEVQKHHENTLIMSLHQPRLAKTYAKRIIGLKEGRVVFDGPSDTLTESKMEGIYGGKNLLYFDDDAAPVSG